MVARALAAPRSELRLILCHHHIRVSLFYLVGVFDLWGGIRTLFVSAAGAYAITAYIDGPYMPWVAFVYLMGHMLYSHLYRELYPIPGIVDVTGAQMVLVMKVGDHPSLEGLAWR